MGRSDISSHTHTHDNNNIIYIYCVITSCGYIIMYNVKKTCEGNDGGKETIG